MAHGRRTRPFPCSTWRIASRCSKLQHDRRDQHEPDEHVQRHEPMHAEQDRRELDRGQDEENESDDCCQALVPDRVESLRLSLWLLFPSGRLSVLTSEFSTPQTTTGGGTGGAT